MPRKRSTKYWRQIDGVLYFQTPGTNLWNVDIETPDYDNYLAWVKLYTYSPGYRLHEAVTRLKEARKIYIN